MDDYRVIISELKGNAFSLRTVFLVPLQGHLQNAVANLRKQIDCKIVGFFSQARIGRVRRGKNPIFRVYPQSRSRFQPRSRPFV